MAIAAANSIVVARENIFYPPCSDDTIKVLDPSFAKYKPAIVGVERLATGMTWSEGPVWFGDGRYLDAPA